MGFFDRMRDGLSRTKQQIVDRFEEIVQRADEPGQRTRPVDVDTVEALEELLISADVGIAGNDITRLYYRQAAAGMISAAAFWRTELISAIREMLLCSYRVYAR